MDKPFSSGTNATSHKKGFALIITLSVLAVVIALTGVLISYLDVARKNADETKALLQANLYFSDMKTFISKFKEKKTLYGILYLSPIPLRSEDGRFSLIVQCKPLTNGVNINWLKFSNNQVMSPQYNAVSKVFEAVMEQYEIEDPVRLETLLLEEMGVDEENDIEKQSRLRQKNGIISYQQFKQILSRYQFEVDDEKVGTVPWEKYFIFMPVSEIPEENLIDGDYLSMELLSVLFDVDIELLKEEWIPGEGALKDFLARNSISNNKKLYVKGFVERASCDVYFDFNDERFGFSFEDDEGEVKNFDFYGKQ